MMESWKWRKKLWKL